MIGLDVRTITVVLFLISALLALMLLAYWRTQKTYNGFGSWTTALLLVSAAYFLIMLRDFIPDWLSIIVANLLIAASILFRLDGIRRFFENRPLALFAFAILLPVLALFLWFTYIDPSIGIRAFISALVVVPGLILIGAIAIRSADRTNRILSYSLAAGLIGYAALYALRSWYWIGVVSPDSVFSGDDINSIFFIATIIMDILSAGFFLMLNMVRARKAAAANEELYRTLSDSLPDLVVVHDGKSIVFANPATSRFIGIPLEKLRGMPVLDFIAPERRDEALAVLGNILTDPAPTRPHETLILLPDGSTRTCIIRSVPIILRQKAAVMSVLTDITERKQMENALRMVNRKLSLLSGITRHDIRNQLTALGAYLSLAAEPDATPAEREGFLHDGERIAETIGRQISFTKEYESLGVQSPVWQNVESLARKAALSLPMRGIVPELRCAGFDLYADPLLEKVFYNLFENSLRYGGETMTEIRVLCEQGSDLRIIVEDNGAGISAADKPELFRKGFGKNTGFGLFFSREILGITDITIAETGEPGKGARFEMTVPAGAWRVAGT